MASYNRILLQLSTEFFFCLTAIAENPPEQISSSLGNELPVMTKDTSVRVLGTWMPLQPLQP